MTAIGLAEMFKRSAKATNAYLEAGRWRGKPVIAEEDLRMRGPGELLGVRQAGLPRMRFGNLRSHGELLRTAKDKADQLLHSDPDLSRSEHQALRALLASKELEAYGSEGG